MSFCPFRFPTTSTCFAVCAWSKYISRTFCDTYPCASCCRLFGHEDILLTIAKVLGSCCKSNKYQLPTYLPTCSSPATTVLEFKLPAPVASPPCLLRPCLQPPHLQMRMCPCVVLRHVGVRMCSVAVLKMFNMHIPSRSRVLLQC